MALGKFRFLTRWSAIRSASADDQTVLEQRDRQIEDYLSSVGLDIDTLRALSGYIKGDGAGGFTAQAAPIPAADGGTGQAGGYAVGDLLYASGASALSKLAAVATGNALISGGVTTAPSWGKVGLTTHVSGTLAVGNGGTGATTHTSGNFLKGAGASAITSQAGILYSDIAQNAYSTWSPTLSGITLGNGTQVAEYVRMGRLIHFLWYIVAGSTTSTTGQWSVTVPVTPQNIVYARGFAWDNSATDYFDLAGINRTTAGADGGSTLHSYRGWDWAASSTNSIELRETASSGPFTVATSDILYLTGVYPAQS